MKRWREGRRDVAQEGEEEEAGRRVNKIFRKPRSPGRLVVDAGGVCPKWWSGTARRAKRGDATGVGGNWSDARRLDGAESSAG